jgi:hypothetical protein
MNRDDLLQNLQTSTGSKRPSPSPADRGKGAKKSRTQPCIKDPDRNILDNGLPSPFHDNFSFPSQDLYHDNGDQFYKVSGSQFDSFTSGEVANISLDSVERRQHMLANTDDSVPYTGGGLPTSALGVTELLDRSHPELSSITEPWPGDLPTELAPINSFLPSSTQLDDQSVFSESQANQPFSQSPTALLSAKSMDVYCEYDTCFGVVSHVCPVTLATF